MKIQLIALLALLTPAVAIVDPYGFSKGNFETLIHKLEIKEIGSGDAVDSLPLLKPMRLYLTRSEGKEWSLAVFEFKKRRLHIYIHDRKLFMARLFDERKGGREKDIIYFCDEIEFSKFLKAKKASANQTGYTTPNNPGRFVFTRNYRRV